ncbi:MAG: ribonuclease HII [Eubacteriales bacterium]|nr:ribonuclease HII [Eubacteriales bacterium]
MTGPNAKRLERSAVLVAHDSAYLGFGTSLAGMDEAGRGPLLGPVVAACVVMPGEPVLPWVDDSKKLSEARREAVYEEILACALYVGVGEASAEEIDTINILQATKLAMRRAASEAPATLCLVDAVTGLSLPFPIEGIIHGDAISYSIAAASIVAKVTRDRQIRKLAEQYPRYGLERNKGYGTAEHIQAIRQYGPCPQHRRSFIGKWIAE